MDEKEKSTLKNGLKKTGKVLRKIMGKKILIITILIVVILVFLTSFVYLIDLDDATYKEGDMSNTPYAASQYTNNMTINSDGTINSNITAQELWDKMKEEGSRVNLYLDGPEELQKLMNAQLITQYLDTRPNPDEDIDWESLNDPNSNKVQGIVKLKRATADGETQTMTYVNPQEFQALINRYNATGEEEDKQEALKHFTLEKGIVKSDDEENTINSLEKILFVGDSFTVGLKESNIIKNATFCAEVGVAPQYWIDHIDELPEDSEDIEGICVLLGVNNPDQIENMKNLIKKLKERYPQKDIYVQKVFYVGNNYTYTDKDTLNEKIDNFNNKIKEFCTTETKVFFIDTTEGYVNEDSTMRDDMLQSDGLHLKDYEKLAENIEKRIVGGEEEDINTESNENKSDILCWPTTSTIITSDFGYRYPPPAEGASSNHTGIDIGVAEGSEVYACEDGVVVTAETNSWAGYWVVIDHGNGYQSQYLHNSAFKVSVGDTVKKGQVIALSGSTGISTGPHLDFRILHDDVPLNPISFKYENGMGEGTGGFGNNTGLSTEGTEIEYYAKVATWKETTKIVESNDPDQPSSSITTYDMTSTKIKYQDLISGYTMPFDYLWAMMVVTEDKEFVFGLIDLVQNSKIEITVHDNLTETTNVKVNTYTENTKVIERDVVLSHTSQSQGYSERTYPNDSSPYESSSTMTVTNTVITKSNTLDISLTKADVWVVKYTKEYTYQIPETTETISENVLEDIPYTEAPDHTNASDDMGYAEDCRDSEYNKKVEQYSDLVSSVEQVYSDYYYSTTNRNEKITNTVKRNKYVASPAKIEEKTDPNAEEPNFSTILMGDGCSKARIYLISSGGSRWLFEILESNESTAEMVDLTKYLLYKATGTKYDGIDSFDFSIFDPKNFKKAKKSSGSVGWEFTKTWENLALWNYINGNSSYSGVYVTECITEDKKYYIMHDDIGTGFQNRNFGFGVCFYVGNILTSSGATEPVHSFQNQSYFEAEGINIEDPMYQNYGESKIEVEIVDRISYKIWNEKRQSVLETVKEMGAELESYQIDCLTDMRYQGWYITDTIQAYMDYGLDESKIRAASSGFKGNRGDARWKLFSTGQYTTSDGQTLDPDKYGNAAFTGDTVTAAGHTYPHYLQGNYSEPYGTTTIAGGGCLPTSLAMILAGLLDDPSIDPITVADAIKSEGRPYYTSAGSQWWPYAESWFLEKHFGVKSKYPIGETEALEALSQGYPVLGGEPGHYLVYIPVPEGYEDQGYLFYILDSARGHDGLVSSLEEAYARVGSNHINYNAILYLPGTYE